LNSKKKERFMIRTDKYSVAKKTWEKPRLVELGVEATETGSGGTLSDSINYGPGTATTS
jgi:hypothetical protein